jgi:hypothetical protein
MFRKTVLVNALSLAFSSAALTVAVVQPAMAQSNATGSIYGVAPTGADIKVRIENPNTGIRRTVTPEANGRFQATSLPTGTYKVYLLKGDQVIGTSEGDSRIGGGTEVAFATVDAAATGVQSVQITGVRRTIDVANTNNGASFSARQLDALPIARNVEAIIQLAPNTTRADSRFDGGASFGGGAASENSYYINGFPVVNPLTGLGASQLPFGAIAEAQVLTGGFGAEFGRSIGGVVNIISKSGTNNWEGGLMYSLAPKSMRATYDNINYANTGKNPNTDNTLRLSRNHNTREEQQYGAYLGGPIIKDKLFVFAAYEGNEYDANAVNGFRTGLSNAQNGWRRTKTDISRYMLKLDWNINDNHRLEYTGFGDTPDEKQYDSGFNYATDQRVGGVTATAKLRNVGDNGGISKVLKYTGNLTDDLTVTALFGRTVSEHTNDYTNYNSSLFSVSAADGTRAPGITYNNPQTIPGNILAPGSKDVVKAGRLDLEYRLGKHTIRGGLDKNEVESLNAGEFKAGGGTWIYHKAADATLPEEVSGGVVPAVATRGGLGAQGYYVGRQLFSTVTTSYGEQSAQYLEDKYQITKDVLLTAGVRRESFKNQNDSKTTFLNMKAQYNPRFAAAWDVYGDASLKVFGTAGRYSVPIPTHISVRGAGRSTYTEQFFTYSGVNADGSPIIVQQLTEPLSGNNEFGQDKDVKTLAALDMKPAYQDEMTIGFEKAFSPSLNFGAKATYRKMKSTIDDFCDVRPFEAYAAANGIAITNPRWGNTCQTFNPGQDNDFYVDYDGTGANDKLVHLTAEQQGFGKPKRTYAAIDLFAEHPFRNGWYAKVMYTWSQNKGNTEGQVRSDNGQQDVAVTSTWDYPELMVGSYGLLPNDRKHQLKAYGFYAVTPEVIVGGNVLAAAGRPRSCIGSAPSNPNASPNYSNQAFYCLGDTRPQNVLTPRGSQGNLPWDTRLDLNVAYKPAVVKGLTLKLDVYNVTNRQTVQNVTEAYNNGNLVSSLYGTPLSLTAPRYAKFTVSYDHKF